jgi:transcriptional repressor NrdR
VRCPYCADENSKVIDSRLARDGAEIRRRRECVECTRRFTTRERVDAVMPKVAKRDERREDFRRDKILAAVHTACQKRPVSADAIEKLVERVERYAQELGDKEIPSRVVGERVMQELAETDALGAARFASVFHDFQNADDYARFFASIRKGERESGSSE